MDGGGVVHSAWPGGAAVSAALPRLPAVHVDLTLRTAARELDLAVVAAAPVPLAAVREQLLRAAGLPPGTALWHGRRRLADADLIGADVLPGAVLTTSAGPEPPASAGWQLQVVGGPQAGAVRPLGRDALVVGRDPACGLAARRRPRLARAPGRRAHGGRGSDHGSRFHQRQHRRRRAAGRSDVGAPEQLVRVGDALLTIRRAGVEPASTTRTPGAVAVRRRTASACA